jgi:PRTRC genetic system protein E
MNNELNEATAVAGTGMFSELMPMAAERTILITISRLDEKTLCVNFVPKVNGTENNALATPLCLKGTPDELDQHLVEQVRNYVAHHATMVSDLAEAQREMDEAAKKAREDARKRNGKGAEKGKPTEAAAPEPQPRTGPAAPTGPTPLSLFDQADGAENSGDSAAAQHQQQGGRP